VPASDTAAGAQGTYNIFENAARLGVPRVATASRAGVTGQPNDGA
jgi:nucleoside-diphosphate-sugar epimerase